MLPEFVMNPVTGSGSRRDGPSAREGVTVVTDRASCGV